MVLRKDLSQNLFSLFFCIFATENVSQSRSEKNFSLKKKKNLSMSLIIHLFLLPL